MIWEQWWFWLIILIFAIPALSKQLKDFTVALRGDPDRVKELNDEIVGLKHELSEVRATKKAYELQREMEKEARERLVCQPPGETVAIIGFCDLVGFTEFLRRQGDQKAKEVLGEYNRMVRNALNKNSGIEIKQLGDGFLFSFDSSRRALTGAFAIRDGIEDLNSDMSTELSIRVGLHAGEVIREDGDVIGSTVNLAERVMSEANQGEIVTSEAFKNLVGGNNKYRFEEIGERTLKGFPNDRMLFRVERLIDNNDGD